MNSTTEKGRKAEAAARVYLEMRGYQVLEQNWRRPNCEIDVVARKDGTMHFVEVKYRANDAQGGGIEAVTSSKVKQMQRAAWTWVDENEWPGEYVLSAVELAGPNYTVMNFIENVF